MRSTLRSTRCYHPAAAVAAQPLVILSTLVALALVVPAGYAQRNKPADNELVRFENGRIITTEEFEYAYEKRFGKETPEGLDQRRAVRQALKDYTAFVRKVMAGEALGIDTTAAFQSEYASYVEQLRASYLSEGEVLRQLVDEAFERSQEDVRARHILLRLPQNASEGAEEACYLRALALRDSVVYQHIPFAVLARRHSEDRQTAHQGGDLGYFSVLEMLYPVENAAYQTPVGQVSLPVRSRHGYHLVYVQDRVRSGGPRETAHILFRHRPNPLTGKLDSSETKERAYRVYYKLANGETFADMAAYYSDDKTTAFEGGVLGSSRLMPALEAYKYRLGVGQFSAPFLTEHGWHILTVTNEAPAPRPAELRAELKLRIRQDGRYALAQAEFLERLRQEYKYKVTKGTGKEVLKAVGPHYVRLNRAMLSRVPPELLRATAYTFADQKVSVLDVLEYRLANPRHAQDAQAAWESDVALSSKAALLAYEEAQLAVRYPEYRARLREYHDGMLLFTLMEENVWRRASQDTAGLRAYYFNHMQAFERPPALRVVRLQASSVALMDQLLLELRSGSKALGSGQLTQLANETLQEGVQQYNVHTYVLSESQPQRLAEFLRHRPGWATPIQQQADGTFVAEYYAETLHPGGLVPFEQCRAEVSRAYQHELEEAWNKALAKKYPATVRERTLRKLLKDS